MIDLKPFCGTEETRPYLMQPFSRGEFTYATNGHICVRVPRRDDAPEQERPDVSKLCFEPAAPFEPASIYPLPPVEFEDCEACDGRGAVHDCPACQCVCEWCSGKGECSTDAGISASILGHAFNLKYVRMLFALPELIVAMCEPCGAKGWGRIAPLAFRFDGGEGLLMSMSRPFAQHIDPSKDDGMGTYPHAGLSPETQKESSPRTS